MISYIKHAFDILEHKLYVFKYGLKLKAPIFNLITHDISKFSLAEFVGYHDWVYKRRPDSDYPYSAVNKHQKGNPHHWQYYVFLDESGKETLLEIPEKFMREMVADWAASSEKPGRDGILLWWSKNKSFIRIHEKSKARVESLINTLDFEAKIK